MTLKRTVDGKNGPIEIEIRDITQNEFDDLLDMIDDRKAATDDRSARRTLDRQIGEKILPNYDRLCEELPRAVLQSLFLEAIEYQERRVDTKKSE